MSIKKAISIFAKTILPLFVGIYLFWYFFSSMSVKDKAIFYDAIEKANYFWILLTLIIGFTAYCSRAARWKYVLEPIGFKTKFWHRYHAIMIGYLMNLTIPRAGEPTRSAMLYRTDAVPFSKSFGTIIAERAVDLILLCSIAFVTLIYGLNDFQAIKLMMEQKFQLNSSETANSFQYKFILYSILGFLFLIFALLLVFKASLRKKFIQFAKDVINGVFSIFKLKNPFAYLFHSIYIWIAYLLMFGIAFQSIPETSNLGIEVMLMGFIAGSLGIIFTNGGIGSYPLLVGIVIAYYLGSQNNDAFAIGNALGMLIWTSQTVLLIILGLISLVLMPKNFEKENESNRNSDSENL